MKLPLILIGGVLAAISLGLVAQSTVKVSLDGHEVSARAFVKDGVVYVPVSDMAKALGKSYAFDKASGIVKITDAGGVNQKDGSEGKAGETLSNGSTRLTVGTSFTTDDGHQILAIEARNAEKAAKDYNFGFNVSKYTLYDADGNSLEGSIVSNDYYSTSLSQATFKRIQVKYAFPEGFKPVRMVVELQTQISGHPPRLEVFRVAF